MLPQNKKDESPKKKIGREDDLLENDDEIEDGVDDQDADLDSESDGGDADEEEGDPKELLKQALEEIKTLQSKLKRANKQAAERRIRLKKLSGNSPEKGDDDEDKADADRTRKGDAELQAKYLEAQRKLRQYELTTSLEDALDGLEISFASARARSDALGFARAEIEREFVEEDDVPGEEDLQEALKKVVKSRPYLVKAKKEAPETDTKKRGKATGLPLDEKDIANMFGIKPM